MRQVRLLTVALTVTAIGPAACGGDSGRSEGETNAAPTVEGRSSADPGAGGEAIVIKTRVTIPTGDVLAGSFIGESDFCPGGSFRDEHGNDIVGLVARTFNCPEGVLKIGFSPEQPGFIQRSN